jgi:hypothetical protein
MISHVHHHRNASSAPSTQDVEHYFFLAFDSHRSVLLAIHLLAITFLTTLAEFTLMRRPCFSNVMLSLHLDAYPLLEPVRDSFDIRILVKREVTELIARFAALVLNMTALYPFRDIP